MQFSREYYYCRWVQRVHWCVRTCILLSVNAIILGRLSRQCRSDWVGLWAFARVLSRTHRISEDMNRNSTRLTGFYIVCPWHLVARPNGIVVQWGTKGSWHHTMYFNASLTVDWSVVDWSYLAPVSKRDSCPSPSYHHLWLASLKPPFSWPIVFLPIKCLLFRILSFSLYLPTLTPSEMVLRIPQTVSFY